MSIDIDQDFTDSLMEERPLYPKKAAGGPQEARSEANPTSPTGEEGSAVSEAPGAEFWDESSCAHEWAYTGTAYGGDDPRWSGEGRCYCAICGADGDA